MFSFGKGKKHSCSKYNFNAALNQFTEDHPEKINFIDLPSGKFSFSGNSLDKVNVIKTEHVENMTIYTSRTGPTMLMYSKREVPKPVVEKRESDEEIRSKDEKRAKKDCKCGPVYYIGVNPDDLLLPDRPKGKEYYDREAWYGQQEHAIYCRCFDDGRREMECECYPQPDFGSSDDLTDSSGSSLVTGDSDTNNENGHVRRRQKHR